MDQCKDYEQSRVENILARVRSGTKDCNICGKRCHNTQKLRNQIQSGHLGKTDYMCDICHKFFGHSRTLKIHKRVHSTGSYFQCNLCKRRCMSLGKLNDHNQSHEEGEFVCSYCNTEFFHSRKLKDQKRVCKDRPTGQKIEKIVCRLCGHAYNHRRDLKHHIKSKHDGADI